MLKNIFRPLKRYMAGHQHHALAKSVFDLSRWLCVAYDNLNYDQKTNGESRVLQKLSAFGFKTVIDVGANIGDWCLPAADILKAQVHALEPLPPIYRELLTKIGSSSVKAYNIGLSDVNEETEFFYYPGNSFFSGALGGHGLKHEKHRVVIRTGESFLKDNRIGKVDFLKIDVEGLESRVLAGFGSSLREIDVVQFEYNDLGAHHLFDFNRYFDPDVFAVGKIFPRFVDFNIKPLRERNFIGPNVIAVRKDRRDIIEALARP